MSDSPTQSSDRVEEGTLTMFSAICPARNGIQLVQRTSCSHEDAGVAEKSWDSLTETDTTRMHERRPQDQVALMALAALMVSAGICDAADWLGTDDGLVLLFSLSGMKEGLSPMTEIDMGSSINVAPILANGILYITSRSTLYAIQQETQ